MKQIIFHFPYRHESAKCDFTEKTIYAICRLYRRAENIYKHVEHKTFRETLYFAVDDERIA